MPKNSPWGGQGLLWLQDSPVTGVFRVKVWSLIVPISQAQPFVTNMLIKETSNSEKQIYSTVTWGGGENRS